MKKKYLFLLIFTSIIFTACQNKEQDTNVKEEITNDQLNKKSNEKNLFVLTDMNDENKTISVESDSFKITDLKSEITIIYLYTRKSFDSKAEIPYFIDLQNKYKDQLAIVGITTDNSTVKELDAYIKTNNINYIISKPQTDNSFSRHIIERLNIEDDFTLPIIIMFKGQDYYAHYEGATPIEMIEHDIKDIIAEKKD